MMTVSNVCNLKSKIRKNVNKKKKIITQPDNFEL